MTSCAIFALGFLAGSMPLLCAITYVALRVGFAPVAPRGGR
jgi:hypothetical protein